MFFDESPEQNKLEEIIIRIFTNMGTMDYPFYLSKDNESEVSYVLSISEFQKKIGKRKKLTL